jgi:hypothetical protein
MFQYLPLFGFPVLPALLRFLQNRASMNLLDGVLPEQSQKARKAMEEGSFSLQRRSDKTYHFPGTGNLHIVWMLTAQFRLLI